MRALLIVILFTLVAAPAAAQQATMEVTVTPPASLAFQAGGGAEGDVAVSVTMQGVLCGQDTTIDVALNVPTDNLTSTMAATVTPTTVTVNVTQGQYATTAFSGSGMAVLNVTATNDTEAGDYDVAVIGTVSGLPNGCSPVGSAPDGAAEGSGTSTVSVAAAPEPEAPPPPPPEDNGLPAPGWLPVSLGMVAVALALRRRG